MALRLLREVLHLVEWDKVLQRSVYAKIELISHFSCGHGELTERMRHLDVDIGAQPENELDYDSLFADSGLQHDPRFQHLSFP